jgi:hypothetical protein
MKRPVVAILGLIVAAALLAGCRRQGTTPTPILPAVTPAEPTPTLARPPTLPPPPVTTADAGAAPTSAPLATVGPIMPWPADAFGYGVQSHVVVGDPAFAMDVIENQLGMSWVKIQLEWAIVEPDPEFFQWFFYEGALAEATARGLNVMVSVVGAPAWTRALGGENGPPDDYALYGDFLTLLLNRYPGQIQAVEVWNEQNLDREWETAEGISAARYVEFLAQASARIKAVNPEIIVISGALAPTGINDGVSAVDDIIYLDQALAAG